ncbi:peptidoglycan-binding domain-containing protein [Rhizobium sp.]
MSLSKYFNVLMASAVSLSIASTPIGIAPAFAQSAPAAEAPGDSGWQKEFEMWRASNKGGKAADYQKYLRTYPNGKFANVAKKRIEELSATAQATTVDADQTAAVADTTKNVAEADSTKDLELWRQVSKSGKLEDYQKYLKDFPEGKFAKVAKTRIETLSASAPADDQSSDVAAQTTEEPAEEAQDQAQTDTQADDQAQDQQAENQAADEQPADDTQAQNQADETQSDVAATTEAAKAEKPSAAGADWEQEYALWKAASDGNTVIEYEAYLKTYPDGKFAAIAQARIAQLAAAETPDPTISEGDQQDTASKNNARRQKSNQADDQQQAADDQGQDDQQQAEDDNQGQDQQMDQAQDQGDEPQNGNTVSGRKQNNQNGQDQAQFTEGNEDTEDATLDSDTRHEIQGRLSSLGYDTQGTDGVFGNRSRDAIASWQQDNGAPVTGYLSDDQTQAIFAASAATYATWLASRVPVRVQRVRPRTEWVLVRPRTKIVVVKRRPNAVVVVKPFRNKFRMNNRVKVKFRFGNCRKKRRC